MQGLALKGLADGDVRAIKLHKLGQLPMIRALWSSYQSHNYNQLKLETNIITTVVLD